jgi:Mg2+ and Co2+ transporter CorA
MAAALSTSTPTKCQARTRLYRKGKLVLEGFPVSDISEHLKDKEAVVWLDLRDPDRADLAVLSDEFGLHPLAIEDAVDEHERPKLDRYRDLANSILETNLTIQGNRMNIITKKVTGWAAIVAVPTFITGFYGMNVPYPGFDKTWGFIISLASMIIIAFILYLLFKKKDWI